ncbi:hypothetical protein FD755_001463 [Muntiacus reevesi]|uniref:RING-type E3 ubiquitin transferase n=1 Tax=Muntiacus reevesi TaxID=9886 RepID=A0A5J5N1B7_MUNRE|nr:hypothetical protein FD755_001463 [Muntiacus reevesi]
MHGLCKEGDNCHYSHGLSNSPYGVVCKYEHSKPLKREDATATDPTAKSALLPSQGSVTQEDAAEEQSVVETKQQLCPYAAVGERRYGENCTRLHGDACDTCGLQVLHPLDAAQSAAQQGHGICSNCMEVVYEKANPREHRFQILSNCCLKCIRKWRSAKQQCLIMSNFVIPSEYWVEEREEKQKLFQKYKEAMSCGSCPLGGNCFYKHAYPDGCREEPQNRNSSRHQRRATLLTKKVVIFELGEILLMLLAAGGDDDLTDAEDEWDLFHDELEDFYDLDL